MDLIRIRPSEKNNTLIWIRPNKIPVLNLSYPTLLKNRIRIRAFSRIRSSFGYFHTRIRPDPDLQPCLKGLLPSTELIAWLRKGKGVYCIQLQMPSMPLNGHSTQFLWIENNGEQWQQKCLGKIIFLEPHTKWGFPLGPWIPEFRIREEKKNWFRIRFLRKAEPDPILIKTVIWSDPFIKLVTGSD